MKGRAASIRRALTFAGVAAVAFLAGLGPIADGDIYWHLAAGRWMLDHHALVRVDPFTVSGAGRPWIDVHWLFQLGVAALHRRTGFVGLTIAKSVLVAGAAVVLTRSAERAGGARARLTCAVMLGAALIAARHLLALRPVIVTVLFLALTLSALEGWRVAGWSGRRRFAWPCALALLQIIWVSCQGLAPLGPALIAAYLIGEALARARRRVPEEVPAASAVAEGAGAVATRSAERPRPAVGPLASALALVVLASFVTPYGLPAVTLPLRLLARLSPAGDNVFSTSVAENIPPFVLARTAPGQIASFTPALWIAGVLLLARRPRLPMAHLIALGGFLALALAATRNILLFYVVASPILAAGLASPFRAPSARRAMPGRGSDGVSGSRWERLRLRLSRLRMVRPPLGALGGLAGAVILTGEMILAGVAIAREAPIARPTPFRFPVESARRLDARGAVGSVFAPDHHGGYLTFALPALRPYIDTRLILHTRAEYARYLALVDHPADFDAFADREGFRYVVLTTSNPDRYLALAAHLVDDPAWSMLYTDGSELLFARASEGPGISLRDPAVVDAIRAELAARFPGETPIARTATLNLARLLIVTGASREAERVLVGDGSRPAAALRARARFVAGDLAASEALARVLLEGHDDAAPELALLGEIALARRRTDESRSWLRRALVADSYAPEARSLLARLEALPRPGE